MSEPFNGKNVLPEFPEDLSKVVNFLLSKADKGEFTFYDDLSYWDDHEDIVEPLGLGLQGDAYYFAVSLAYLATLHEGSIVFTEKDNEWRWAWSLNILSEVAQWQPAFMKRVMDSIPRRRDGIENLMNRAAHTYARRNYEDGLGLLQEMPQYRISIKAGLMENEFGRYCSQFAPDKDSEEFADVLVQAAIFLPEDTVANAFDVAIRLPSYNSPVALASLLEIHPRLDDTRRLNCEQRVKEILQEGNTSGYVNSVANWAVRQRDTTPFLQDVILLTVRGLCEDDTNHLAAIDHAVAFNHDSTEFLVKLVVAVVESVGALEVLKLETCIHNLSKKKDEFLSFVLSFLLHPKGLLRMVGRRLWDEYHLEASEFDVSELEETLQCVFIISMLQDYGNPETRLPKVLPLLESNSKKVRTVLRKFLRPYLDDYMGHVISALDKTGIDNDEAKEIRQYFEKRSELLHERRRMKELSPLYTDGKVFREAVRRQNEHLQEQLKEAEKDHKPMWHDLMATVVLARGGGWRETDGTTHHLPVTQFSMPSRQMRESMSPKEQDDWINDLLKDWNDTARDN